MRADLHVHTTASDGSLSPGGLAVTAAAGALDVISICDHDTVAGVAAARAAAPATLRIISGVEVSSMIAGRELHVLGYGVDITHPRLVAYTERAAAARTERMQQMLDQLAGQGVSVSFAEVLAAAEVQPQCVGRPHLARALVNRGIVKTVSDAFDRYIGNEAPAYVAIELLEPADAIELIHAAGGLAVWAHPRMEVFDREVRGLQALGLDGVECYRPRLTPPEVQYYEVAARDLGLLRTGGSDWHGVWHGPLGSWAVDGEALAEFLAALKPE